MDEKLKTASQCGDFPTVELLIKSGVNVHVDNDYPLKVAARHGYYSIVDLLIKAGADTNVNNNYPLRIARENCHYKIVELLTRSPITNFVSIIDPSDTFCCICGDETNTATTECFHTLCYRCYLLLPLLSIYRKTCPMCRRNNISLSFIFPCGNL